jgi:hypothetical protein
LLPFWLGNGVEYRVAGESNREPGFMEILYCDFHRSIGDKRPVIPTADIIEAEIPGDLYRRLALREGETLLRPRKTKVFLNAA